MLACAQMVRHVSSAAYASVGGERFVNYLWQELALEYDFCQGRNVATQNVGITPSY